MFAVRHAACRSPTVRTITPGRTDVMPIISRLTSDNCCACCFGSGVLLPRDLNKIWVDVARRWLGRGLSNLPYTHAIGGRTFFRHDNLATVAEKAPQDRVRAILILPHILARLDRTTAARA